MSIEIAERACVHAWPNGKDNRVSSHTKAKSEDEANGTRCKMRGKLVVRYRN